MDALTPQTPELDNDARQQAEASIEPSVANLSAGQVVEQIAVLLQADQLPERKQIDRLKALFYSKKEQLAQSGDKAELEQAEIQEERMNDLLAQFRELDRKRVEAQEALYESNRQGAEALLVRLEALLESGEEFRKVYDEFHQIREQWESFRPLNPQDESRLRKVYAPLRDRFYELKNINEELREYDFRKNLEAKRAIIDELRPLVDHPDPIYALKQMNAFAARWHDLGPVARDLRQEISSEYKELSSAIYRRHQEYQDQKRTSEQTNLDAKQAIVARLEAILTGALPSKRKGWEELTEQVKALQAEWKSIGHAGRRDNDKIFQRLRAGMDAFFQLKSEFYSRTASEQDANLEAKRALLARAKELRDSTEWDKATEALKELQQQWMKIGAIPQKYSQSLWKEFRECFDTFFERKKAQGGGKRGQEHANLKAKRAILEELRALQAEEETDGLSDRLKALGHQWQAIGHVPYSEKDALNTEHKALLDELYGRLRSSRSQRRLDGYSAGLKDIASKKGGLQSELQRMERIRERLRSEIQTYDNNLSFLSVSSKGASALLKDVERKRQALEEELALLDDKIALLRQQS